MVERFFLKSGGKVDGGRSSSRRRNGKEKEKEKEVDPVPITLLSGPPSSGKTSLLFQYALNSLEEEQQQGRGGEGEGEGEGEGGGHVVFMCNRRRLEAKPPSLPPSHSHLFHRIHFKYVHDQDCLKKYLAAFHLLHPSPLAIIIDDFGDLFHLSDARARDWAMVRVLALSQSAVLHACKSAPCKLLLSDTHHGQTPRLLFLYRRWISSIFTIEAQAQGDSENKSGSLPRVYIIKSTSCGNGKTTANYSIALPSQYLIFEGITITQ